MNEAPNIRLGRWAKIGIVLAGYATAMLLSGAAVAIYDRRFTPADNQAMGGMIAGGEMMFGYGVFLVLALAPTGLSLWFLRASRRFWSAFSIVIVAFAAVGLAAVIPAAGMRGRPESHGFGLFSLLGLVQMLSSPLWIAGFALFAWLAPEPVFRGRMMVALAIEVVIAGCAVLYFLPAFSAH